MGVLIAVVVVFSRFFAYETTFLKISFTFIPESLQKDQADAPATQSETENGNTEEAVVPAVDVQEAAEAGKF